MSFEAIKEELARLSPEEQRSIMGFLVKLNNERADPCLQAAATDLDDSAPEIWLTLEESKALLAKKWASES